MHRRVQGPHHRLVVYCRHQIVYLTPPLQFKTQSKYLCLGNPLWTLNTWNRHMNISTPFNIVYFNFAMSILLKISWQLLLLLWWLLIKRRGNKAFIYTNPPFYVYNIVIFKPPHPPSLSAPEPKAQMHYNCDHALSIVRRPSVCRPSVVRR